MSDPLADLGLDDDTSTKQETAPVAKKTDTKTASVTKTATTTEEATATREEVDVGEIEFGYVEYIPTAKRRTEGSKYQFDKLPAPGVFEDGPNKGKPKIAQFTVKVQPGVDPDKLRRSVQSATTQANKTNKDKYFVSRTVTKDGALVGMMVLRTDQRPA